jgi:hypothetical protein
MFRPLQVHHQGGVQTAVEVQQILSKMCVWRPKITLIINIITLTINNFNSARVYLRQNFAVIESFCIFLPDDDCVEVETYVHICIYTFNVHGSVHRNNILIHIQKDATLHSLFYLVTVLHISLLKMGDGTTRNMYSSVQIK